MRLTRFAEAAAALPEAPSLPVRGSVCEVAGVSVRATLDGARVGEAVEIAVGGRTVRAVVVALREGRATLLPMGDVDGLALGAEVALTGRPPTIRVGEALLGRVLDGTGAAADRRPLPPGLSEWPTRTSPPPPLVRARIREPFDTGLRAVDAMLTVGIGQRIGVFASPGVGKSTLLGHLARHAAADVNVVALVGERGREVREFIEDCLGPEGLARSVVVVATSDAPSIVRLEAAHVATAIAEWFADVANARVLFLFDSVTRYARAQREVGLAAGEPPARQGYPPSVFAALPRLLERTGVRERGAITAFYTVLVAGGDMDEPVADEVRGILDGHIVLERRLAERGHWPAIDVLASLSRSMPLLASARQRASASRLRELVSAYERDRDLVTLGAYVRGTDPRLDEAIERAPSIEEFLRQGDAPSTRAEAVAGLEQAVGIGAANGGGEP